MGHDGASKEFIKKENGTFDIFHQGKLVHSEVPDNWLEGQLTQYGFCGEEYREIRRQLQTSGRAEIILQVLQFYPN